MRHEATGLMKKVVIHVFKHGVGHRQGDVGTKVVLKTVLHLSRWLQISLF